MGIKHKSFLLFLSFYSLLIFSSCAALPSIEDYGLISASADSTPKIIDSNEELSPKISKAIIEQLKVEVEPTNIIQRHTFLVELISGSPLFTGNKVTLLIDGPDTYDAMLKAIRDAKDTVNFETYLIEDDEVGRRFADLLLQKQAEGVQVKLIYDSVGSISTSSAFFQRLRDGGIQVREFNPLNPLKMRGGKWLFNHRDHRKILIVDGKVTFTGGLNISNVYSSRISVSLSKEKKGEHIRHLWRDTDIQIEGPAVAEFQKLFLETWAREGGPEPTKNYFPPLKQEGNDLIQVVWSAPGRENRFTYMMYVSAFTYAEKFIHVTVPYLIPDEQMIKSLSHAVERGVDVKIILPGASLNVLLFNATRSFYTQLLKAGVKLYEHRADSMLHAKTAVIDGIWSTVGSTNLDSLSFINNDEVNAAILSCDFATKMEVMFEDDLGESNQIHLEEWKKRPFTDRVNEWFISWFSHWL